MRSAKKNTHNKRSVSEIKRRKSWYDCKHVFVIIICDRNEKERERHDNSREYRAKKNQNYFVNRKSVTWQDEIFIYRCSSEKRARFIILKRNNNLMNGFLSSSFTWRRQQTKKKKNVKLYDYKNAEVVSLWKFGSYQINGLYFGVISAMRYLFSIFPSYMLW